MTNDDVQNNDMTVVQPPSKFVSESTLDGFHLIPNEIIEEWSKGEYYSGDIPSLSYKYLGHALKLRGWYTYEAWPSEEAENEPAYRGIAKIDIKGPSLFMGGIRLFNEKGNLFDSSGRRAILFWKSEISYFLSENEIIWFYHTFNHGDEVFDNTILANYLPKDAWLKEHETEWNERSKKEYFGFGVVDWNNLLDQLRVRFDDDIRLVEVKAKQPKKDSIDVIGRVLMHHDIDQKRIQYREILSPGREKNLIAGSSKLSKVSKLKEVK